MEPIYDYGLMTWVQNPLFNYEAPAFSALHLSRTRLVTLRRDADISGDYQGAV